MATGIQKLLFVDTNIWLDFYRARNEAYLELLEKVEAMKAKIIVTHQLETEYKANRQSVILESVAELKRKEPSPIPSIGVLAQAQQFRMLSKDIASATKRIKTLQDRLIALIEKPAETDPVYQACQRIFHKNDALVLTRDDKDSEKRKEIRERAQRRFFHGCPPRKRNDSSYGDAINWEWMVDCSISKAAELVIVSRDTDYGVTYNKKSYINDHLRHEFSNRVSQRRELLLYTKLSDALKHFHVPVSPAQVRAEDELFEEQALMAAATDFEVIPEAESPPTAVMTRPRRTFPAKYFTARKHGSKSE